MTTTYLILSRSPESVDVMGAYKATIVSHEGKTREVDYTYRVTTDQAPPQYSADQEIKWQGNALEIVGTRRTKAANGKRPRGLHRAFPQTAAGRPTRS